MIDFSHFSFLSILLVSIVVILSAAELGHGSGSRIGAGTNTSTLEAAILGFLALMMSFTFSMALTHFDARRAALLEEANSIGTAALRARLLPAPHDETSLTLLRDYTRIQQDHSGRAVLPAEATAAIARSNDIQDALWAEAKVVIAKDNSMAPTGIYIQALNEMFDNQEKRLTAWRNRVPNIVLLALYAITVVAIGFTGYASGPDAKSWRLPVYVMGILAAAVILLIQDVDAPNAGFVSVSEQPMIDTAANLERYVSALGAPSQLK